MGNHFIKYGLFYGLVSVAYTMLLYMVAPKLLFDMKIALAASIILPIIFMYMATKATREDQEGLMSFGEALKPSFLTYALGSLIAILFSFVFYNFIDPGMLEVQQEVAVDVAESVVNMMGGDQGAIEEAREAIMAEEPSFSIGQAIISWLGALVLPGLIIALIMSAIMKKNPSHV